VQEGTGRIITMARPLHEKHSRNQASLTESIRKIIREPARPSRPQENVVPFGAGRDVTAELRKRPGEVHLWLEPRQLSFKLTMYFLAAPQYGESPDQITSGALAASMSKRNGTRLECVSSSRHRESP
jgi:hypothetical protein